jgi:hypothetical protein
MGWNALILLTAKCPLFEEQGRLIYAFKIRCVIKVVYGVIGMSGEILSA